MVLHTIWDRISVVTYILQVTDKKYEAKMIRLLRKKCGLCWGDGYNKSTWITGMATIHQFEFSSKLDYRKAIRLLSQTTFWENITRKRIT